MDLLFPCSDRLEGFNPDALSIIGRELLERVREIYVESSVDLPEKHVWTLGQPIIDCAQLVVSLLSLEESQPEAANQTSRPCDVPISATFQVAIFRCVPLGDKRGNLPSTEEISAFSDVIARDAYILMYFASCLDMFGADVYPPETRTPFEYALGGRGISASVEIGESLGGYQAAVLNLTTVVS